MRPFSFVKYWTTGKNVCRIYVLRCGLNLCYNHAKGDGLLRQFGRSRQRFSTCEVKGSQMSYQQIIIVGNVGRDPELKYLPSGVPVCNFTVAVNERWGTGDERKEKTTWFRVAAWRQLAETVSQYLTKGSQVMVIGTVDARAYNDNGGQPAASLELTARDVRFLGSRDGQGGSGGGYSGGGSGSGGGNYDDYGSSGGGSSDANDIPF